jgi:hypothetical protein
MILQMSSGSIRNVCSLSKVMRSGVAPIFASTVRPITVPDGTVMVKYGTYDPFVLAVIHPMRRTGKFIQFLLDCVLRAAVMSRRDT